MTLSRVALRRLLSPELHGAWVARVGSERTAQVVRALGDVAAFLDDLGIALDGPQPGGSASLVAAGHGVHGPVVLKVLPEADLARREGVRAVANLEDTTRHFSKK